MKNTLNKKWGMRKYNEGKTPSQQITVAKIKKYLIDYPKTSGLSLSILSNWHLTNAELAKKFKTKEYIISRFRSLTVRWMNGKRNHSKSKRVIAKVVCKSPGKNEVRNGVLSLLLDSKSPKSGIVPTLPFKFDFEKSLIKMKELSELKFWGFEFAYNASKGVESRKRFKEQIKTIESSKSLSNRLTMFYKDINDVLKFSAEDQFAHIFADYCGTLNTNQDAIISVLQNKCLKIGGLLWVTINPRNMYGDKGIKNKLLTLAKDYGNKNYKIEKLNGEEIFKYQGSESGTGAPMYAIAIRRIK